MGLYGKEKGKMSDRIMIAGTEYTLLENTATFPKVGSVACQGVRGAYSEQAAKRIFNQTRPMFFKTFGAVIHAVKCGMCEFGVLPIENNSYGSVRGVYEALRTAGVHIVHGDRILIRHQLLVKPGTKPRVMSRRRMIPARLRSHLPRRGLFTDLNRSRTGSRTVTIIIPDSSV